MLYIIGMDFVRHGTYLNEVVLKMLIFFFKFHINIISLLVQIMTERNNLLIRVTVKA